MNVTKPPFAPLAEVIEVPFRTVEVAKKLSLRAVAVDVAYMSMQPTVNEEVAVFDVVSVIASVAPSKVESA